MRDDIAVARRIVVDVQRKIDFGKSNLTHHRVGCTIGSCATHALEEIVGDRFSSLVMTAEEIERFAFPAPILHDHRGQLDEIPSDVGARLASKFDPAEDLMHQVTELVENGL